MTAPRPGSQAGATARPASQGAALFNRPSAAPQALQYSAGFYIVRVGNGALGRFVGRFPLPRAGRALLELPVELEQVEEVLVRPFGRRGGPGVFRAAGDRVGALAGAVVVFPAKALRLERRAFGLGAEVIGACDAVRLAERVPARDQRDGFLVFLAMRAKDLRMSRAAASGSGSPLGPWGLT